MICISCSKECTPAAFMAGRDGHMYAVCAACMDTMTVKHIRECEWAQFPEDLEDYPPGLIEEDL